MDKELITTNCEGDSPELAGGLHRPSGRQVQRKATPRAYGLSRTFLSRPWIRLTYGLQGIRRCVARPIAHPFVNNAGIMAVPDRRRQRKGSNFSSGPTS